jgi:GR25 family glycosyltransferase involved in LPS biosynthesis
MYILKRGGMHIGITCQIEYSVFSSGNTNTSIAIAEMMIGLGHTVSLLNIKGKKAWWDDCIAISRILTVVHLEDLEMTQQFDLLFEISQLTLSAAQRAALAPASVWILRKPFVLNEIESSIYPITTPPRDMAGIQEAWLLRDITAPDDIYALDTFARVPVRIVPFVWTPILAEAHSRVLGPVQWRGDTSKKFVVHCVDTNTTSASSSTIPLVILREAARQKLPLDSWKVHNGENVGRSKFFLENVVKHCTHPDLSGQCVGRQRCVEWMAHENHIALSHIRFNRIRPVLLDLAWVGIPVIHNSPALRDIGCGAEELYYPDNAVEEGVAAFKRLFASLEGQTGWSTKGKERREMLLRTWSPISPIVKAEWGNALAGIRVAAPLAPVPAAAAPAAAAVPEPEQKQTYTIVFCDMWENFQGDYNFFTLLLNEAGKTLNPPRDVRGVLYSQWNGGTPDLVIFGPFGSTWKSFPESVRKVHYTGENTGPVAGVALNLGFKHTEMNSSYIRMPLWLLSIDWFGADTERLVNPKPISLSSCTQTRLEPRSKFCAFVVSNPSNTIRNQAFQWLNTYKPVDSAGRLYNTIGADIFAGAGGGGGELAKQQFLQSYKFCIAYENSSSRGYCTEKYLHAKAAGCIPIYWGDPEAQRDFDMDGCIDARQFKSPEDLINAVKKLDENEEEWKRKVAVPALDSYRVGLARRTLAACSKRIYEILGVDTAGIPQCIGCEPVAEAPLAVPAPVPVPVPVEQLNILKSPVVATYATQSFLGSLQHWLKGYAKQHTVLPTMTVLVFIGPDISDDTLQTLLPAYPFASFERVPSTWTPAEFTDFWEPSHYAWKLWIYNELATREALKDRLVLYTDAGSVLCRWPKAWMIRALETGVACLEDPREENDRWCGDTFCQILQVTDEERAAKQTVAGLGCFVSGHPAAVAFYGEAFKLAQNRNILVGPRLSGVATDGKSYGHRQDQSILSILVRRHNVALEPLDTVYCDHSMRKTFQSGKAIYVHRGNFFYNKQFLPGIDEAHVINLERRADRMEKLYASTPELEGRVERCNAFDGRALQLTPELTKLFRPNDFFWKKAVTGCALSHLGLWWKLVNEHPEIENYLIFEDDVKLYPGWQETLAKSMEVAPEDYDVIYLGGILPPNRPLFEKLLDPVTEYHSRIKPHTSFGQSTPTSYFHSCAYSYVLSRRGAIKIMEGLQEKKGYWTSADHILCNPCDVMNLYFLTPTIAGCFQDDDPAYANSQFNNFSRIDSFDSDLWNNDERFTPAPGGPEDYEIGPLLNAIYYGKGAKAVPGPCPTVSVGPAAARFRFLTIENNKIDFAKVYERDWLFTVLGDITTAYIEPFTLETPPPIDVPIVILQRPWVAQTTEVLKKWSDAGAKFKILHLSDELPIQRDSLECYTFPGCIRILRTYIRSDFPPEAETKIQVIPLGYRWTPLPGHATPMTRTPQTPFRQYHWSFYGTDWNGRSAQMKPLLDSKLLRSCKFNAGWNDPASVPKDAYLYGMLDSIFVPCPSGVNPETFRMYEALECGCIPIVLKTVQNEVWFNWVSGHIPLLNIKTWEEAVRLMFTLLSKPETLEIYRGQILTRWVAWKEELKHQGRLWAIGN